MVMNLYNGLRVGLFILIGEIHLYLNLFSIFYGRLVLFMDSDLPKQSLRGKTVTANKLFGLSQNKIVNSIYTHLLFPFVDIFCFFYTNLEKGHLLTLPKSIYPRVVIITKKIPLGLLREEIIKDLSELILVINIVALFLNSIISINACHRRLKEPLRIYNPVTPNLVEYLLNFLKYVKSTNKLIEFIVLITASSLFLDSYPPKAYSKRPQYCLPCGHYIYENCIIIFKVHHCFLCREEMPNDIIVKVHPLTVGVGVLCINRGGTRDCRFIKVAFGVSIDYFYIIFIGIKIGLLVATVSSYLLYYIFTNYNGALLEVLVMFPLIKEPNFVISLGTSKLELKNYENTIYRLSIDFNATKPRLNNMRSIPKLKSKVKMDYSLSAWIDTIARYIIASLFYFELDSLLERYNGKYIVTGYILCLIIYSNLAFKALLSKDGNFRKQVDLDTFGKFIISLKEGNAEPYNISRLPFLIENLIAA
ncbi:hypothetical protein V2W45_1465627 [Cenococcum geophilum]